jgi:hypothetical protein
MIRFGNQSALCTVVLLALATPGLCQSKPQSPAKPAQTPAIERITDSLYRIGRVMVDMKAKTVTCSGVVNMSSGAVEYLAVGPGGKLHESVLRIDARPIYVQLGLILLNLEPGCLLKSQGDPAPAGGPGLKLTVRWRSLSGEEHACPAEDFILVRGKPWPHGATEPKSGAWCFTGSQITRLNGFSADAERSLIAVWNDPVAVVNNREVHGGENTHEASNKVPKVGTPVELVIQPAP